MNLKNDKRKLLMIGASALVLALIAFSGVCWCMVWAFTERAAGLAVSYWELLGVSFATITGILLFRPLHKIWIRQQGEMVAKPVDFFSKEGDDDYEVSPVQGEAPKWKKLYDQLSQEEQRAFKAAMGSFVSPRSSERQVSE